MTHKSRQRMAYSLAAVATLAIICFASMADPSRAQCERNHSPDTCTYAMR